MKLISTSSLGLLLSLYLSVVCQVQATVGAFWQAVQIVFPDSCMSDSGVKSVQPSKRIVLIWHFWQLEVTLQQGAQIRKHQILKEQNHINFFQTTLYEIIGKQKTGPSQPVVVVVVREGNPLHPPFPLLTDVLFMIMYPGRRIQE